MIHAYIVRN